MAGKHRGNDKALEGITRKHREEDKGSMVGNLRQRQDDDRWKHDLYDDNEEPQASKPKVGDKDLRLKLQKKSSQQFVQGGKSSGVRDLREKLLGNMHSQPVNTDPPKPKATSEVARTAKKSTAPVEATTASEKKSTNSAASKKKSQSKASPPINIPCGKDLRSPARVPVRATLAAACFCCSSGHCLLRLEQAPLPPTPPSTVTAAASTRCRSCFSRYDLCLLNMHHGWQYWLKPVALELETFLLIRGKGTVVNAMLSEDRRLAQAHFAYTIPGLSHHLLYTCLAHKEAHLS
ncbi:hypothetical protein Taro_049336 [Colocasia esculenta]|uniref:Uncharacterized protein n=1 Tax=Colocasia esculenta TaxID=4460 RepID=A0A843XAS5_COLES|nr:hypothetical protein [Colocasia esculenta]